MSPTPYPKPTSSQDWIHITPRKLLAIQPWQPAAEALPPLPCAPRQPSFASEYTLSTHIIPAASPRTTPKLPGPRLGFPGESKEARQERVEQTVENVLENRQKYEAGEFGSNTDDRPLWNVVNRYVRKKKPASAGGLTLFFAHANGFPKETWEPTIQYLLNHVNSNPDFSVEIEEIWCWEAVQHGDAALLNAENLGGLYDWSDNTRDILNFMLHYLPETPSEAVLPVYLKRIPESDSQLRSSNGIPGRKIVGIGHSFGGTTTVYAAINYPALFSDLILVDPPIAAKYGGDRIIDPVVYGAVARRAWWPSREEAAKMLKAVPFFEAWDSDVLDVYLNCGLVDNPDGSVRLKMTGEQEGILYEQRTAREVYELLEHLDTQVGLRWIMPTGLSVFGGEEWHSQQRVWRRPVNCSNVRLEAGHLIPLEIPKELGREIYQFLRNKYTRSNRSNQAKL